MRRIFTATSALVLVTFLIAPAWAQGEGRLAAQAEIEKRPSGSVTEEVVRFEVDGQQVVGTLALPEDIERPPVILILHGFTGTRDELEIAGIGEGIYERAARRWGEQGYASLRIDFRGSGESEGAWEDTTFSGQITDAVAALEFLANDPRVAGDRIGLVGWSQGGLIASGAAARSPHVDALALWAPVAHPAWTYANLLGTETVQQGLASGGQPVTATLPWGAETTLKTPFFAELFTVDPVAEITGYEGPLLVAVGARDETVAPQPQAGQVFLDYHEGPEELWVADMDHVFNAFTGPETVDELVQTTLGFLHQNLK